MKSSEKNRIQNCMTVSNVGIASVLSDPFGKTATEIMSYLLAHTADSMDEKAVRKLIKKGAKAKSDEIIEAIKGYNIEFVSTLPGMTELSSAIILAETGIDMDVFDDAKHLCSWCGPAPTNNESAGKKKSVRIAKAGDYLKPMMVQCALAAIKSKKQPYFAIKYGRIKKRRGHRKAIIAIARIMMVCIYHMDSEKKPFTPADYEELMDPPNHVERVILNESNVFS